MSRPSLPKLTEMLTEIGVTTETFGVRKYKSLSKQGQPLPLERGFHICDETFGRKSYIFIRCPDMEARERIEDFLEYDKDVSTVERGYNHGYPTLCVGVTYFKGWQWNV